MTQPIALAGIGKIARDAHLPALQRSSDWHLDATISRNASLDGIRAFKTMEDFLADPGEVKTVSLSLPPAPRFDYAIKAMRAGLNVMLEKPPAVTLIECRKLIAEAEAQGVTLFLSWHSRMGAACDMARDRLKDARLKRLTIDWREDIRQFHPDQDWIWDAGNLGVFDPGINAFSILARILPDFPHVSKTHMIVPEGRETPIAADVAFTHPHGADMTCTLDWRHDGGPIWNMEIETDQGAFTLTRSGSGIDDGDGEIDLGDDLDEYDHLYARLAELVAKGTSETDTRPMEMVADAFLLGTRETGAPFDW